MQLATEVSISGVFALNEEIKLEQVLVIPGEWPAIVYALGDEAALSFGTSIHFSVKVARRSPTDRQYDFVVMTQDRKKRITRKKDLSAGNPEFARFECSVHLFPCDTHEIRTQFPQNSFRVFLIDARGSWQMEEFSIIAQNNRAFLARQLIYHGQAYRAADGTVSDPTFDKWVELQEMIRESVGNRELPSLAEASVPEGTVLPSPTIEKGIVKFFGFATGWGSVLVMDRYGKKAEAKAHWKHIYIPTNTGRPLVYLARGEEVTCDLVPPAPTKETLFQYVAIGIRPCS